MMWKRGMASGSEHVRPKTKPQTMKLRISCCISLWILYDHRKPEGSAGAHAGNFSGCARSLSSGGRPW